MPRSRQPNPVGVPLSKHRPGSLCQECYCLSERSAASVSSAESASPFVVFVPLGWPDSGRVLAEQPDCRERPPTP
jgi:hypothetical protein